MNGKRSRSPGLYRYLWLSGAVLAAILAFLPDRAEAQRRRAASTPAAKTIRLQTEPAAVIWVDDVRRGVTDGSGQLELTQITSRAHVVRVRAGGFKEISRNVGPAVPAVLEIKLSVRADAAELLFQEAESAALTAKDDTARQAVVDLYQKALSARPVFAAAHLGLARVLSDLADHDAALDQIEDARRDRPNYAESSAVEGRILRAQNDDAGAAESFRRSIREARGFQPEAHTGLALAYEGLQRNDDAIVEFKTAIAQLSDSEPLLYQLMGALYEKMEKYKEAVAAYEKYLALAPKGSLAPAVRSMIDQLRRQANGEEIMP